MLTMVTLQEVEAKEEELRKVEFEATQISREQIPQRRYGAGITPEEQQQAIARRTQARNLLPQIARQKQELANIKGQVIEQERQQAELDLQKRRLEQYEEGRQAALSNRPTYGLSKEGLKGYKEAVENIGAYAQRREALVQRQKLLDEGLKPIFSDGKLVGFEDVKGMKSIPLDSVTKLSETDIARFERAGVLERVPDYSELQSKPPRYEPFFGKIEKVIKYPFEKLADFEDYTQKVLFKGKYESGFGVIKQVTQSKVTEERSFGAKGFLLAGEFAAFPVYGLKQIEIYTFDKEARDEFKSLSKTQKGLEVTNIGLSLASVVSITASARRFLLKPINLKKEINIPEKYYADTKVKNIRIGEKPVDIAEFKVTAITPPIRAFQISRLQAILSGVNERQFQKLTFEELKLIFPRGKVTELRPLRVSQSITEPFIIRGGRIVRAVSRRGEPVVFSFRGTYYTLSGRSRITKKELSILSGETYSSRTLRTISPSRRELPANIQVALKELEKIQAPPGIKAQRIFDKKLKLDTGGIRLEQLFSLTGKGARLPKPGKSITRGEIAAIQRQLSEVKFERKYGLKELEILREDIGAIDVTFPRLRRPRKGLKIEGIVERKEYEFPSLEPSDVKVYRSTGAKKSSDAFLKQLYKDDNLKVLQKAIGTTAIKQSKTPSGRVRSPKVESVSEPLRTASAFSGTGLYERTELEAGRLPPQARNVQVGLPSYRLRNEGRIKQIPEIKIMQRALPKVLEKEISKEALKEINKVTAKNVIKEITKQTNKQSVKQVSKLTFKSTTKKPPRVPPTYRPPKVPKSPKIPGLLGMKGESAGKELSLGYKPFVIKKGKKSYLPGILPKGKALRKAEREAKRSLRATFGADPTKIKVKGTDLDYRPSGKLFRGYKIKAGKRIPLRDTFIQKLGKRLSFKGEIAEIQRARYSKRGRK